MPAQQDQGLDVVGLREHVDQPNALDLVPAGQERPDVPRKGRRIAGYESQLGWREPQDLFNHLTAEAGAGGIRDDQRGAPQRIPRRKSATPIRTACTGRPALAAFALRSPMAALEESTP